MTKKTIYNLASFLLVMGLLVSVTSMKAYAQTETTQQSLLQKIISYFNLDQTKVDEVVNIFRSERQAERTAEMEEKLNQAVTDGKITAEQKTLILNKHKEWQNQKEDWSSLGREERQEKIQAHREEMHAWAEANGIDLQLMLGFGGGMGGRGDGLGRESGFGKGDGSGRGGNL